MHGIIRSAAAPRKTPWRSTSSPKLGTNGLPVVCEPGEQHSQIVHSFAPLARTAM
jgi:hypothetical protein